MRNVFMGTTKNWSKNVLLWKNLALNETHGPTNKGCSDCRGVVTINSQTGQVTKNVEHYSLAHFSKFIPSGSKRIRSQTSGDFLGVDHVSFVDPQGKKVLVLGIEYNILRELKVTEKDRQILYILPAKSVATITWN